MVALPDVVVLVDVVLVHVMSHVDVSEGVLQLWVVVPWDRREGVEKIWVHFFCLHHVLHLLVERCLLCLLAIEVVVGIEASTSKDWIGEKVSVIVHAPESTHRVSLHFLKY